MQYDLSLHCDCDKLGKLNPQKFTNQYLLTVKRELYATVIFSTLLISARWPLPFSRPAVIRLLNERTNKSFYFFPHIRHNFAPRAKGIFVRCGWSVCEHGTWFSTCGTPGCTPKEQFVTREPQDLASAHDGRYGRTIEHIDAHKSATALVSRGTRISSVEVRAYVSVESRGNTLLIPRASEPQKKITMFINVQAFTTCYIFHMKVQHQREQKR